MKPVEKRSLCMANTTAHESDHGLQRYPNNDTVSSLKSTTPKPVPE